MGKKNKGSRIRVSPEFNIITDPDQDVAINNGPGGIALGESENDDVAIAFDRSNAQTVNGDQALVGKDGIAIGDPNETAVVGGDGTAQVADDELTSAKDHSVASEDDVTLANDNSNAAEDIDENQQARESGPGGIFQDTL